MHKARFRFYGSLNDFLSSRDTREPQIYQFWGTPAIKDAIEAMGIPHPEVDLILVHGESVGFDYGLKEGDEASVYPRFFRLDIDRLTCVRPRALHEIRFVLDGHLGRLASYLRMLGFDTLYQSDFPDHDLARISAREHRLLLTRDRGLLKRNEVQHGYYVRQNQPRQQLIEVMVRFDLCSHMVPFTRCMRCNDTLNQATKEQVRTRVPLRILHSQERFLSCPDCKRVYWQGSHHAHMQALIEAAIAASCARQDLTPP